MKGAVMVDVVRSEDDMLDGGHQGVEAEGLAVMEVHAYQPCRPALHAEESQKLQGQSSCHRSLMCSHLLSSALFCLRDGSGRSGTGAPDVCMSSSELNLVDLVSGQHPPTPFAVEGIDPRTLAALQRRVTIYQSQW